MYIGNGGVWARKNGDYITKNFPGNQVGIQDALDFAGVQGEVALGPGSYRDITNLTMYAKCTLRGAGPLATVLYRSSSATGTMLRDKTLAEGNPSGATGITIKGIQFDGNGCSGDGLVLGYNNNSFNMLAQLIDVLISGHPQGYGLKLLANAIHCRNLWCDANKIGALIQGGSSHYSGLWCEGNTQYNLIIDSPWNTFDHIHLENTGTSPTAMILMGNMGSAAGSCGNNVLIGTTMTVTMGMPTNLIRETAGVAVGNQYISTTVIPQSGTWTNTIYNETWAAGSGQQYHIPFAFDHSNNYKSFFRDHSNGTWVPMNHFSGLQRQAIGQNSPLNSGATIYPDVYGMLYVINGNVTIDTIPTSVNDAGRLLILKTAGTPTIRHNGGGTGNIRLVGSADISMTVNDVIMLVGDGTLWWQCAPQVVI